MTVGWQWIVENTLQQLADLVLAHPVHPRVTHHSDNLPKPSPEEQQRLHRSMQSSS